MRNSTVAFKMVVVSCVQKLYSTQCRFVLVIANV